MKIPARPTSTIPSAEEITTPLQILQKPGHKVEENSTGCYSRIKLDSDKLVSTKKQVAIKTIPE
jgi:hypothetical protein